MNMLNGVDKHIVVDGQFVSQRISQIVQAIQEYSPELSVEWIPPGARTTDQPAFRIIHTPPGGQPYPIFHVKTEEEFNESILKRIIAGDSRNGTPQYSELEAWETAQNLLKRQKFLDAMEEANDVAHHILKSPKNTYKVSDDLVVKDGIPFNAAPKRFRRQGR